MSKKKRADFLFIVTCIILLFMVWYFLILSFNYSAYFINPKLTSEHMMDYFFSDHEKETKGEYEYI